MSDKTPRKGGAKRVLGKPAEVKLKIDRYFADCDKKNKPYTVAGICLWLGIARQTWHNYQNKWAEYASVMEPARLRVEQWWEERLAGTACTGAIFWLKNNAAYKDTLQQEISGPEGSPMQTFNRVEIVGVRAASGEPLDPDAL